MKLLYMRAEQWLYAYDEAGEIIASWECHDDFEDGINEAGEPRASLPDGFYTCSAEQPGEQYGRAYGTFYINTGDPRGRDIHGGGSSLPDPYASRQGWLCTYGCLRMQNEDGEELSRMMIDAGNEIQLEVC